MTPIEFLAKWAPRCDDARLFDAEFRMMVNRFLAGEMKGRNISFAARRLGILGGSLGGIARARKLSPERRSERQQLFKKLGEKVGAALRAVAE